MSATGLLLKFKEMHKLPDRCKTKKLEMSRFHSATMTETVVAFLVLGVGISAASIILVLEHIFRLIQNIKLKGK